MGLFNKKEKRDKGELPKLPDLPKLPEIIDNSKLKLPKLPVYPKTQLGEKLSQNTIKEAINGKKEDEAQANEFVEEQKMPKLHEIKFNEKPTINTSNIKKIIPSREYKSKIKQKGPVFIRVDKFKEGLEIFEQTKDRIIEMEEMLKEIKQTKENEEKELSGWENEILLIKSQIEKVEKDIFSKIE